MTKNGQKPPDLRKYLKRVGSLVEKELQLFFREKVAEAEKIDPAFAEVVKIISAFMLRRGKCVRPFIAWCSYMLSGGADETACIKVGAAIETNHYFLLSVDDVVDRDTVRHGGPTIEIAFRDVFQSHEQLTRDHYARSFSELSSALLQNYAYEMLSKSGCSADHIVKLLRLFTHVMCQDPAKGWTIHLFQNLEKLDQTSEERFIRGLHYVTAQYTFVGPLLIGSTLAGKHAEYQKELTTFGEQVGLAFQIHDDILGLFGNPEETGKAAGNDVREGKKTLLIQHAYAHGSPDEKKFLKKVVGKNLTENELQRVRTIVISTGALTNSEKLAQEAVNKGIAAIQHVRTAQNRLYVDLLHQLATYVISRVN